MPEKKIKKKLIIGIIIAGLALAASCYAPSPPTPPPATAGPVETVDGEITESAGEITSAAETRRGEIETRLKQAIDSGFLILVNKNNALDKDYKPDDLADIRYYAQDRGAEGRFMRAAAADAFHALVEDAAENGFTLVITTAYRSYSFQSTLYNNYVARDGQAAADRYSAQPGKSEHQTGLAADVSSPSVNYALTAAFANTDEGKWLAENARRFGFIIRYPEGMEEITGYQYEPWHIRFVGPTSAEYIYENKITLEEYLELIEKSMEE